MKRMIFEDVHELSTVMLYDASNLSDCVSAICHYEMATALLSEIIQADVPIGQIDISDYEWSGYDKEYAVTLMDGNVYCNPLFGMKKDGYSRDGYLESYADIAYIHQDCNSKLLSRLEYDKAYEFAIDELDEIDDCDDYDDDYEYGCCDHCPDMEDDDLVTQRSDFVTVSRDRHGNPTGFSKSWFRDDGNGVTQYSSYSYYCNNEDILRSLANDLNIKL